MIAELLVPHMYDSLIRTVQLGCRMTGATLKKKVTSAKHRSAAGIPERANLTVYY